MNRKFAGILLILCFLVPAATTFIYLEYQKEMVKEEVIARMLMGMDKDLLVLLKFTKKEAESKLDWEHSKEFEYRGQMYDVVEFETKGDTTFYWCWEDKKETHLEATLENLIAQTLGNNPQNQENGKKVYSFFKSLYFAGTNEIAVTPFREMKTNNHFAPDAFQAQKQSPPAPPPKMA